VPAAGALSRSKAAAGFELILHTKTGMGDGHNNPWLQEFLIYHEVSWDITDCFKC
jgi:molybdopterin-containing oxidoreductase family iron-sulfur binding subunit